VEVAGMKASIICCFEKREGRVEREGRRIGEEEQFSWSDG